MSEKLGKIERKWTGEKNGEKFFTSAWVGRREGGTSCEQTSSILTHSTSHSLMRLESSRIAWIEMKWRGKRRVRTSVLQDEEEQETWDSNSCRRLSHHTHKREPKEEGKMWWIFPPLNLRSCRVDVAARSSRVFTKKHISNWISCQSKSHFNFFPSSSLFAIFFYLYTKTNFQINFRLISSCWERGKRKSNENLRKCVSRCCVVDAAIVCLGFLSPCSTCRI